MVTAANGISLTIFFTLFFMLFIHAFVKFKA